MAELARQTLAKLPPPVLNGALGGDLEPLVIDRLAEGYVANDAVMERLLGMPRIAAETIEMAASRCGEHVASSSR